MPLIGKGLPRRSSLSRRYPSAAARLKRREIIKQKEKPWYDGGPGTPALPGAPCRTPPHPDWTEPEQWVWEQVCAGKFADFNSKYKKKLAPIEENDWKGQEREKRKLSPDFLRTLLTRAPWENCITENGVRVFGAVFERLVDLSNVLSKNMLWLDDCRIENGLFAHSFICSGLFSLDGSVVLRGITIRQSVINSSLMLARSILPNISIGGTKIDGQLVLAAAKVSGEILLNSCDISGGVFLNDRGVYEGNIYMQSTNIGGQLNLNRASFGGTVKLNVCKISRSLLMRDGAYFKENVILGSINIESQLDMSDSVFIKSIQMERVMIKEDCFIENSKMFGELIVGWCEVGGELVIWKSIVKTVRLGGSIFTKGLSLGWRRGTKPDWLGGGKLDLRNTKIGYLADRVKSWPDEIDLEGCVYNRLGGLKDEAEQETSRRPASWYIDWLSRHQPYSPQPYEQCAKVLGQAGQPDKSNAVLYAGKNRERRELTWRSSFIRKSWLSLMWLTMGYGFGWRYVWSLLWAAVLVAVGVGILDEQQVGYWPADSEQMITKVLSVGERWSYSLGTFLPAMTLEEWHKKIELYGYVMAWFAFLKISGYGLLSLIVARITGVTK